jgi:hypothetical protein
VSSTRRKCFPKRSGRRWHGIAADGKGPDVGARGEPHDKASRGPRVTASKRIAGANDARGEDRLLYLPDRTLIVGRRCP